jgi:hypothetical protein
MKPRSHIKVIALAIFATASSVMANVLPPPPLNYFEFQWQTSDGTFSPTYLTLAAYQSLSAFASAANFIDFEITTPNGVWTPTTFTPAQGSPYSSPFLFSGSFAVTGMLSAPVLTFGSGGVTIDTMTAQGGHYEVNLTTSQISNSQFFGNQVSSPQVLSPQISSSTGTWVPVPLNTSASDPGSSLLLFIIAVPGLLVCYYCQRAKA